MEQSKIDLFIATTADKFPPEKIMIIRDQLEKLDDNKFIALQSVSYQSPTTLLILSIFFGGLGVDRFILGDAGLGVLKLLTCGGLGIWTIVDWFLIMGMTKEYNYKRFCLIAV